MHKIMQVEFFVVFFPQEMVKSAELRCVGLVLRASSAMRVVGKSGQLRSQPVPDRTAKLLFIDPACLVCHTQVPTENRSC